MYFTNKQTGYIVQAKYNTSGTDRTLLYFTNFDTSYTPYKSVLIITNDYFYLYDYMNYKMCSIYRNQRINYQLLYGPPISYDILFVRYIGSRLSYITYNSLSNLCSRYDNYYPYTLINYIDSQYAITLFMN